MYASLGDIWKCSILGSFLVHFVLKYFALLENLRDPEASNFTRGVYEGDWASVSPHLPLAFLNMVYISPCSHSLTDALPSS